ncbi:hypothetical protein PWT90_05751 [Aphanocladium album]|nr:hypothetical protein PWT90_05751 [Aphanocladium album]
MSLTVPENAPGAFTRGSSYTNLENSSVLAYRLQGVTVDTVIQVCRRATETYAREILNWPEGRLTKPDIFSSADAHVGAESVEQCAELFAQHLTDLYQSSSPKEDKTTLSTYPYAFIVVSPAELPHNAIVVVVAYPDRETWRLEQRLLPVDVELGQCLDSLRRGDISAGAILHRYTRCGTGEPLTLAVQSPLRDTRVFAVFSTGLTSALPLPALIDPTVERVPPSEAMLHLVADPANSQLRVTRDRMLELFPLICRDDARRGWRTKGRALNRRVFICCDNDRPAEEGVLVVRTDWDGDVQADDETLRRAGREAQVQETRVGVKEALAKAREMAGENNT